MKKDEEYRKYQATKLRRDTRLASCSNIPENSLYLAALIKNKEAMRRYQSENGKLVKYKIPIELCEIYRKLYE